MAFSLSKSIASSVLSSCQWLPKQMYSVSHWLPSHLCTPTTEIIYVNCLDIFLLFRHRLGWSASRWKRIDGHTEDYSDGHTVCQLASRRKEGWNNLAKQRRHKSIKGGLFRICLFFHSFCVSLSECPLPLFVGFTTKTCEIFSARAYPTNFVYSLYKD